MISLVVAAAQNNAIGKDNKLLWHLPRDLKFFKDLTWGMVVVMGRKTFESLGKPLPGRLNIVVTTNPAWKAEGVRVVSGLQQGIDLAAAEHFKEIFIIGGGAIYEQSMALADKIYLTRVHARPVADTFFPELNTNVWKLESKEDFESDEKHAFDFSFEVWKK